MNMKVPRFILLTVIAAGSFQVSHGEEYRLPGTQIPSSYDINLSFPDEIFDGTSSLFKGNVAVTFQTLSTTNILHIHSPNEPNNIKIVNTNSSASSIDLSSKSFNKTTEILQLFLVQDLETSSVYELTIDYEANVDVIDRKGVYRSKYTDSLGLRRMITTQFQPTYARKAFPCFDEPKYKASFRLSLTFPIIGFQAMSNTPVTSNEESG